MRIGNAYGVMRFFDGINLMLMPPGDFYNPAAIFLAELWVPALPVYIVSEVARP